ncbi:Threonine/homoserine efflux transporter RhtA [Anaerobranca californiensis DSM 14826]|uniref:Threonine/homoserine efflux transporter RhtA n=1 Tax=Anaerobranca californiensis DSM 14826 TaxID=1120989 RepID=A0A1M6LE22_9FIRM|nr:EamA family transporter [Anaerobranca californiensis]SHJ69407.1 Threonine/homoserine efflux transporter RhtA [Anaerobranca californiensis DSM 14826]
MKNSRAVLANLAILLTILLWGVSGSITKLALRELTPSLLATVRFFIAGILLLGISYKKYGKVRISPKTHFKLMICGLVGYSLYFLFENHGFNIMSAANGTIILATISIFTIIMEVIFLKIPTNFNKTLGVTVSIIGVIMVIGNSITIEGNQNEVIGSLLMLGAAISWSVYSIISRGFEPHISTLTITAYQMIYGTIFLFPIALLEGPKLFIPSTLTLFSIAYLALLCSALANFLYLFSLKELGASGTNIYINLSPFVGVIAAYFILGESLSFFQYLGGTIIVLGVYLVNGKLKNITISKSATNH